MRYWCFLYNSYHKDWMLNHPINPTRYPLQYHPYQNPKDSKSSRKNLNKSNICIFLKSCDEQLKQLNDYTLQIKSVSLYIKQSKSSFISSSITNTNRKFNISIIMVWSADYITFTSQTHNNIIKNSLVKFQSDTNFHTLLQLVCNDE